MLTKRTLSLMRMMIVKVTILAIIICIQKDSLLIPETTLTMGENVLQSDTLETLIKELSENNNIRDVRDHLGRSLLHRAAQGGDIDIVECLFSVGFNPNIKEKCGATPLIIGVISKIK